MFKKLAIASLIALVFTSSYAQINVDTTGGTTGGAITSSPLSNSVSSVGNLTTGASTSAGGAGGAGGSVGSLATGASTSTGGSVGNTSSGASSSQGNTSEIQASHQLMLPLRFQ